MTSITIIYHHFINDENISRFRLQNEEELEWLNIVEYQKRYNILNEELNEVLNIFNHIDININSICIIPDKLQNYMIQKIYGLNITYDEIIKNKIKNFILIRNNIIKLITEINNDFKRIKNNISLIFEQLFPSLVSLSNEIINVINNSLVFIGENEKYGL